MRAGLSAPGRAGLFGVARLSVPTGRNIWPRAGANGSLWRGGIYTPLTPLPQDYTLSLLQEQEHQFPLDILH
jgi:hypothetical protein